MGDSIMLSSETVMTIAFVVIGFLLGIIGHFVRGLHKDFRDVERTLPDKYVRKDDFHRALDEIKAMLQRMFDRLDEKQDK